MTEEEINQALDAIIKDENGIKALEILHVIAYFAPENIHQEMLSLLSDNIEAALTLLMQYSMVTLDREKGSLRIELLVQQIIRTNLEKQKKEEEILKKSLAILFVNGINSNNLDHAISVWSYVSGYPELIEEMSGLPSLIINGLRECVRYEEANIFGFKTLDLLIKTLGERVTATLTLQHTVGTLLSVQGRHKEALEILQPLSEKDAELSCKNEYIHSMTTIARQLCELSHYNDALPVYEIIFGDRQVSETKDRTILTAWHDYALLKSDLGKYSECLEILKDVSETRSEILGVLDADTLSAKNSIAQTLIKLSKYNKALRVFQDVLVQRTIVLGEDHIDTLRTRDDIAYVLLNQGKYDEASEIYQVVVKKFEEILGKAHPDTLATQANLATTFHAKGESQKALEVYKDVYKIQSETLGQEHNETLRVKRNIALILLKQKKFAEALRTFKEVLRGMNRVLGAEHPDTVDVNNQIESLSMVFDTTLSLAKDGNLNKMRSLVQNGADINAKDDDENTPLHYAVQYGHITVIKFLFESGAIYNIENKERKMPMHLTKNSTIKGLLNSVAQLFLNVRAGNHNQVAELIRKEKTIVNVKEGVGSSSLHWAAYNGHTSIVRLLLESGADAIQVTIKGNTPLHMAASKGYREIVEVLLQHLGHDKIKDLIDAKTTVGGNTALHTAADKGSLDVVKSLLKHGAIYNIKNNAGKTPLDLSTDRDVNSLLKLVEESFGDAKSGNVEIIRKLRAVTSDEFVAVTNGRNNEGNTLLQVAIANKHKQVTSELLEMLKQPDQNLQDVNVSTLTSSISTFLHL